MYDGVQIRIHIKKVTGWVSMKILLFLSEVTIPLIIFYIVAFGILQKVKVYESFITGAAAGLKTVVKILPTLIGLMVAVGILRGSGFLDMIGRYLGKITDTLGFPAPLVPLVFVRMFSSSAATGLALDIFKEYGTDSRIGFIASIMLSCTETIFYTMSVYFMTAKITKTRYTLAGALLATFAGIAVSVALAGA
jgi:spore maturation protein B